MSGSSQGIQSSRTSEGTTGPQSPYLRRYLDTWGPFWIFYGILFMLSRFLKDTLADLECPFPEALNHFIENSRHVMLIAALRLK